MIAFMIFILTILFTILKLMSVIAWSWLWVFSPIWLFFLFIGAFSFTAAALGIRPEDIRK